MRNGAAAHFFSSDFEPAAPFAIIPLVMFTANRKKMGELAAPGWVTTLAAITAAAIIALNIKLLADFLLGSG